MKLALLPGELAVARLGAKDPVPEWVAQGALSSVTRTGEELSVVCTAQAVPRDVEAARGWRALRVVGRLDFSTTGVIASLASPLAAAGLSIFALSTYDTDYLLVKGEALETAVAHLRQAGHEVTEA